MTFSLFVYFHNWLLDLPIYMTVCSYVTCHGRELISLITFSLGNCGGFRQRHLLWLFCSCLWDDSGMNPFQMFLHSGSRSINSAHVFFGPLENEMFSYQDALGIFFERMYQIQKPTGLENHIKKMPNEN